MGDSDWRGVNLRYRMYLDNSAFTTCADTVRAFKENSTRCAFTNCQVKGNDMRSILVVEEDHQVLETLEKCLVDTYEVRQASSGVMAITELRRKISDLIVTALDLPDVDGGEITQRHTHQLKTIIVDAYSLCSGFKGGSFN